MGSSLTGLTGSMLNKMSQFYACYCMSLKIYSLMLQLTRNVPVCGTSLPLLNMRKLSLRSGRVQKREGLTLQVGGAVKFIFCALWAVFDMHTSS